MRISAKVDYALRAMAELAAHPDGGPVKAEQIATSQDIPIKFLVGIMNELKRGSLVRSQRGAEGGYSLTRAADEIALADVVRAIDGPLANVHDVSLSELTYSGPAKGLVEVWQALRTSLRSVLETTSLADLTSGSLPAPVRKMAKTYRTDQRHARR